MGLKKGLVYLPWVNSLEKSQGLRKQLNEFIAHYNDIVFGRGQEWET